MQQLFVIVHQHVTLLCEVLGALVLSNVCVAVVFVQCCKSVEARLTGGQTKDLSDFRAESDLYRSYL